MDQELIPYNQRQSLLPDEATDDLVIETWLRVHRSIHTQRAYRKDIKDFFSFIGKTSLREVKLVDLLDFEDDLAEKGQKVTTIARKMNALKSLLTFACEARYIPINVGKALKPPQIGSKLAERIMTESQMLALIHQEPNKRNHALLRLMYNAGIRVTEVANLTWNDLQENASGGQVTIFGKGQKERYIVISIDTYNEVQSLRGKDEDTAPIFRSRKGGHLTREQIFRIVEQAAIRANIAIYFKNDVKHSKVSPHWIRHAHASHSIQRGASIPLVRDTLGHANIVTTNKYSHAKPEESSGKYLPI